MNTSKWSVRGPGGAAVVVLVAGLWSVPCRGSVLFDATKAEQANNADWVIDEDNNVAQRFPTPAQGGITAATPETYWTGGLSAWGVTMVKRGVAVETLPRGTAITYGTAAAQDLKNYTVYAVVEPNNLFTTAEKTAMINFVKGGGSLFMVSDHGSSDRDNDGVDSIDAWNDFLTTANTGGRSFGFTFNGNTVTPTTPFVDTAATDPVTHGAAGTATDFAYASGSTLTLTSGATNVSAAVWASSAKASNAVMVAYGTYGAGRFVAVGDSSPFDDGTGASGDNLFNGWTGDANGNDATLITNATLWLNAVPEPGSVAVAGLSALLLGRRSQRRR